MMLPMNLPSYFLADLPPEATVQAGMLREACLTLKRNRAQYLVHRSTASLIQLLSATAAHWADPAYPLRRFALEHGPARTGFTRQTLARGLDSFFAQLTAHNLGPLVEQEFGHPERLDKLVATAADQRTGAAAIAHGPELLVQITAGNVPNPTLMSIVHGVLVRAAQFIKCASGSSFLPRLFAHSLYEADPKLASCLELAEWPGGQADLEQALYEQADCVTATGSDETLAALRAKVPATVRFLGYGHRVSFGYVAREALTTHHAPSIAARAAHDIAAWNQLGCLSPHVLYVEDLARPSPEQFAELLATALAERERAEPRGDLPPELAADIVSARNFYLIRAEHSSETKIWWSEGSTAWTVVYESDPLFQPSRLNRFIYVKPVAHLPQALQMAERVRGKVSTVGLAAPSNRAQELAAQLAAWGVTRICPLGQMQNPPLTWRHDGRPVLGDLVTWSNWEPE